jgi:hypothetical protein
MRSMCCRLAYLLHLIMSNLRILGMEACFMSDEWGMCAAIQYLFLVMFQITDYILSLLINVSLMCSLCLLMLYISSFSYVFLSVFLFFLCFIKSILSVDFIGL